MKFNDQVITYDAIGNPLSIGNTIQFNWINGRSLYSYADIEKNLSIRYKYNKDGIREEKNVNGVVTKYYLENNSIIYEQRGNNEIYYLYDLTGLVGFKYNGEVYYYVKNLQGDIIGILDKDYNQVITYEYDSWGKLLSIKDNLGNEITDETNIGIINPFRYRGYYYDTETGLYYLNSRYYNPRWGRFLNADGILGANEDILSYNLYAYVSNNPVINIDLTGNWLLAVAAVAAATWIGTKVIAGVAGSTYLSAKNRSLSKKMYDKSLWNADPKISNSLKKDIEEKTKNTKEVRDAVNNCIYDNRKKNFSNCTKNIEYKSGDLHYSMQHVSLNISGQKINDTTWSITLNMSDKYDFTEFREPNTGSNIANDIGFMLQHTGMLYDYYWDVTYSFTHRYSYVWAGR